MKYLLLIYGDGKQLTEQQKENCCAEGCRIANELHAKGQYLAAAPLQPIETATSVRVREGRRIVTDGPFAETREHLGGFFLIDVPDLDEAIAIASRLPPAQHGTIEVRPILELSGLPKG